MIYDPISDYDLNPPRQTGTGGPTPLTIASPNGGSVSVPPAGKNRVTGQPQLGAPTVTPPNPVRTTAAPAPTSLPGTTSAPGSVPAGSPAPTSPVTTTPVGSPYATGGAITGNEGYYTIGSGSAGASGLLQQLMGAASQPAQTSSASTPPAWLAQMLGGVGGISAGSVSGAPSAQMQALLQQLTGAAQQQLENPTAYDDELWQRELDQGMAVLDSQGNVARGQVEGDAARRGLDYSTIRGTNLVDLEQSLGQGRDGLVTNMLRDRAQALAAGRAQAMQALQGVAGLQGQVDAQRLGADQFNAGQSLQAQIASGQQGLSAAGLLANQSNFDRNFSATQQQNQFSNLFNTTQLADQFGRADRQEAVGERAYKDNLVDKAQSDALQTALNQYGLNSGASAQQFQQILQALGMGNQGTYTGVNALGDAGRTYGYGAGQYGQIAQDNGADLSQLLDGLFGPGGVWGAQPAVPQ